MGTNYYLHENVCTICGRGDEPLHIGKSIAGWCFGLHVIPEQGLNTLEDWAARWAKGVIKNEYDRPVTPEDMMSTIADRSWGDGIERTPLGYPLLAEFYRLNYAVAGPNGLVRKRICAENRCIGHGSGTWDLTTGEFS